MLIEVFTADNLTTPVARYNITTKKKVVNGELVVYADTFVLPREFFIRASGATRLYTGDYNLTVRLMNCATREDACPLRPGDEPQYATLTGTAHPGGVQNDAWFRFWVKDTPESGVSQTIRLIADGLADPNKHTARLADFIEATGGPDPVQTDDGVSTTFAGPMADGSGGYLVISQSTPGSTDVGVSARMESDLKVLKLFRLICEDETNPELGSDEIFSRLTIDGVERRSPPSGYVTFNCDEPRDAKDWSMPLGKPENFYVGTASFRLIEDDDLSPTDLSSLREFKLPETGPHGTEAELEWDNFDDGHYALTYQVLWRRNEPVEDPPP